MEKFYFSQLLNKACHCLDCTDVNLLSTIYWLDLVILNILLLVFLVNCYEYLACRL